MNVSSIQTAEKDQPTEDGLQEQQIWTSTQSVHGVQSESAYKVKRSYWSYICILKEVYSQVN